MYKRNSRYSWKWSVLTIILSLTIFPSRATSRHPLSQDAETYRFTYSWHPECNLVFQVQMMRKVSVRICKQIHIKTLWLPRKKEAILFYHRNRQTQNELKMGLLLCFSMHIILSINCNSDRGIWRVLLPIWCPIEINRFSLLFVATIDLEFIYFSFTRCEHFQIRRSRENGIMDSHIPVIQLPILSTKWDLVFVCLVIYLFRESRNSLESPFPSNSLKEVKLLPLFSSFQLLMHVIFQSFPDNTSSKLPFFKIFFCHNSFFVWCLFGVNMCNGSNYEVSCVFWDAALPLPPAKWGTRCVYKLLSWDTSDPEQGRGREQRWVLQASVLGGVFQ